MHKNFAEKIKDERLDLGMTITELAKKIGITRETVTAWEKGLYLPNAINLRKLEKFFNKKFN